MNARNPKFWGIIGAVIGLLGGLADTSNILIDAIITAGISFAIWYFVSLAIISITKKGKL